MSAAVTTSMAKSKPTQDDDVELPRHHIARLFRCTVVGVAFGSVLGILAPVSPIFRRTFREDPKGYRVVFHSAVASFIGSTLFYARWVDWGLSDPSWGPWLTPLHAQIPALGAYLGCQLSFPGLVVLSHEPTWKIAWYEYTRLTLKMMVAFYRVHPPVIAVVAAVFGVLFYPLNQRKRAWTVEEEKARLRSKRLLESSSVST
jgi:hypothetical protein